MPFIRYKSQNILFVHIPKTGGKTIEKWMERSAPLQFFTPKKPPSLNSTPQHLLAADILEIFSDSYFDFIFTIFRNPYRRLESEYRWLSMHHLKEPRPSFSDWLTEAIKGYLKNRWVYDNHMRPQSDFICPNMAVYRFEDGFQNIMAAVSRKTDLPLAEEYAIKYNDTSSFDGNITWTGALIEQVNILYEKDFHMFNYPMMHA